MRTCLPLLLCACTRDCAEGSVIPAHQLSIEVVPGASTPEGAKLDFDEISYEEAESLTKQVDAEVFPDILMALDVDARGVDEDLGPGGYDLRTTPAMQLKVPLSDDGATRLAAAFGLALEQESVLVTDWSDTGGGTAYGSVRFLDGAPSADEAQAFYVWASQQNPGLGGGYLVYDDVGSFLNLRGDDGQPYSGLDDDTFLDALRQAAADYTGSGLSFLEAGEAQSWLVANDWTASPDGQDYLGVIGDDPPVLAALEASRSEHQQLLEQAEEDGDWAR